MKRERERERERLCYTAKVEIETMMGVNVHNTLEKQFTNTYFLKNTNSSSRIPFNLASNDRSHAYLTRVTYIIHHIKQSVSHQINIYKNKKIKK